VQERLGSGASGVVWRAVDTNFDQTVALKVYDRTDAREEVRREYTALSALHHDGIVRIKDGDRMDDGRWVVVSEFLDGPTLRAAMPPAADVLDWDEAATITMKLLAALQAAHPDMPLILQLVEKSELTSDDQLCLERLRSEGVTHRDVKPDNIVLVVGRGPVLVDFGLSGAGPVGASGGSWRYRPPGVPSVSTDPDIDLFAVAVILHEMLTGRHPYTDSDPIGGELRIEPTLAPGVRALLRQACSPHFDQRFHSAQQFIAALAALGVNEVPMPVPAPDAVALVRSIRRAIANSDWAEAERLCPPDWEAVRSQIAEHRDLWIRVREQTSILEIDGYSLTFTGMRPFDNATNTANEEVGPGTTRVYIVSGPSGVMVEVLDRVSDSGERWVQGGDVFHTPPPLKRLGKGLRMGMDRIGDVMRAQLTQARLTGTEGWSKRYKASSDELDRGAGVCVGDVLARFGALAYGTQENVYGDMGRNRTFMCVTFDPDNDHVPAVAYFLTRVMPLACGVSGAP
jgi:serine/threonine protein kinase